MVGKFALQASAFDANHGRQLRKPTMEGPND